MFRWHRQNSEIDEEITFHIEARTADLIGRGLSPTEARRQARLEFGSTTRYQQEARTALGLAWFDALRSDLRYGLRFLKSNPGYAFATISILAAAIGVNAAFFSLFSQYVLKPLPIPRVEHHFRASTRDATGRSAGGFSAAEIDTLADGTRGLVDGIYGVNTYQILILTPQQRQVMVSAVSEQFFRLLNGTPSLGSIPHQQLQHEPIAILSARGHLRLFPAKADPVGESIRIRDRQFRIAAVLPPTFTGTEAIVPDFFVGLGMQSHLRGDSSNLPPRVHIMGFLAPGATTKQVSTAFSAIAARLQRADFAPIAHVEIMPMTSMLPEVSEVSSASILIFGVFLLVLLIACANLANLNLARAATREHEIGMRLNLGASRPRIIRQLLTESALTGLLGAAIGLTLATFGTGYAQDLVAATSGVAGITMQAISPDWRVFAYSAILGILAGLAFGLIPALEISGPRSIGRARPRRLRNSLIVGQVAASLVLLLLAGLFARNTQRLQSIEVGYDLEHTFDLRLSKPTPNVLAAIQQTPGVAGISSVASIPLQGAGNLRDATIQGWRHRIQFNQVDENFFPLLRLPVQGRNFTRDESMARARVAIISRSTASVLFPGQSAIGKTFELEDPEAGTYEVIGLVPDIVSGFLFRGLDRTAVYLPGAAGQPAMESVLARIEGPAPDTVRAIRQLCIDLPGSTGCDPAPLRDQSRLQRFPFILAALLSGILGSIALLVTAIGLYSVVSYSVIQRRREIGIQLALGATSVNVVSGLLKEASLCVAVGIAIGLPICLVLSKLASNVIFTLNSYDPIAYVATPLVLAVVAALACTIPARSAVRLDPADALRHD